MTTASTHFGELIFAYTRADAINDGVLVEVPEDLSQEAGITVPVAMTSRVWALIDPGDLDRMPGQSVVGRLWDMLWMLNCAARSSRGRHQSIVYFKMGVLLFQETIGGAEVIQEKMVTFKAVCGPGDDHKPVITVMLPQED